MGIRESLSQITIRHRTLYRPLRAGYRSIASAYLKFRELTASQRVLPDFLIIGAQKAGTTSLFQYLAQHHQIAPPFRKEIHYLSYLYYQRNLEWYKAFFPKQHDMHGRLTGEASTYYHMCWWAPERAHDVVPNAKILFIVRDPVARAFSQYKHSVRKGFEAGTFRAAIERECGCGDTELLRIKSDGKYVSYFHQHNAYVSRGFYIDQLERWAQFFDKDRIEVVIAEELFDQPSATFAKVSRFLGIDSDVGIRFEAHNQIPSSEMLDRETQARLHKIYAPYNQRLVEWLGRSIEWA